MQLWLQHNGNVLLINVDLIFLIVRGFENFLSSSELSHQLLPATDFWMVYKEIAREVKWTELGIRIGETFLATLPSRRTITQNKTSPNFIHVWRVEKWNSLPLTRTLTQNKTNPNFDHVWRLKKWNFGESRGWINLQRRLLMGVK